MYAAAATFLAMFIHYMYDCFQEGFAESFLSVTTIHELLNGGFVLVGEIFINFADF